MPDDGGASGGEYELRLAACESELDAFSGGES